MKYIAAIFVFIILMVIGTVCSDIIGTSTHSSEMFFIFEAMTIIASLMAGYAIAHED